MTKKELVDCLKLFGKNDSIVIKNKIGHCFDIDFIVRENDDNDVYIIIDEFPAYIKGD